MASGFVPPRPFRVNAGPVHAYVLMADGSTKYLSECRAGDEVMDPHPNPNTNTNTNPNTHPNPNPNPTRSPSPNPNPNPEPNPNPNPYPNPRC